MKKQLLLGVAVGALAFASPALAQPPAPVPVFSWTGFYVGVNGGYSWGQGTLDYYEPAFGCCGLPQALSTTHKMNGGVAGIQGGYNLQSGSWVVGVETDLDWTGQKGHSTYPGGFEGVTLSVQSKLDWLGTTRGRVGWLVTPTTLVYTTAGLAYGHVSVSGTLQNVGCGAPFCTWSFSGSKIMLGLAAGAGIEGAIPGTTRWTWRAEYLYVDLGTMGGSGFDTDFGGTFSWNEKVTDNIFRVGLNLKLP